MITVQHGFKWNHWLWTVSTRATDPDKATWYSSNGQGTSPPRRDPMQPLISTEIFSESAKDHFSECVTGWEVGPISASANCQAPSPCAGQGANTLHLSAKPYVFSSQHLQTGHGERAAFLLYFPPFSASPGDHGSQHWSSGRTYIITSNMYNCDQPLQTKWANVQLNTLFFIQV